MKTLIYNGNLITPDRIISGGGLIIEDGKISEVLENENLKPTKEMNLIDAKGMYISPGFIDVHVHGGGGVEVMGAPPSDIVKMCSAHSKYGTTSILPTTLASPIKDLCEAIDSIKLASKECTDSNILGVHLEGPFLSVNQCGAQATDYIYPSDEEKLSTLLDRYDKIKIMGAAPEIENGFWLGKELKKRNIKASIAHSDATFDEAIMALDFGYEDITHIYSGCSNVHRVNAYRIAGVVEAGLYEDKFTTQVIADGKHLPPALLKLIYKCKGPDKIILITDGLAMSASDVKEGDTYLQKNGVLTVMEDGVMKLLDRQSFAGSISTMNQLVNNMVKLADVPLIDAVKMATINPAKLISEESKGVLAKGKDADIVIFDENIEIYYTITNGKVVYKK